MNLTSPRRSTPADDETTAPVELPHVLVTVAEDGALAATVTNPPTRVQVDDLWAHARQHTDDGEQARRLVLSAIRLGWRPMGEQA